MYQQKPKHVLFGFSEKATKFEKNLRRTFDKSIMFCARNSVLVKKLTKNFQNKCDHLIIQTLMYTKKFIKPVLFILMKGASLSIMMPGHLSVNATN